jgi:hypothetical protein
MWLILRLPETNRSPGKEIPTKADVPMVRASPCTVSDCGPVDGQLGNNRRPSCSVACSNLVKTSRNFSAMILNAVAFSAVGYHWPPVDLVKALAVVFDARYTRRPVVPRVGGQRHDHSLLQVFVSLARFFAKALAFRIQNYRYDTVPVCRLRQLVIATFRARNS